jgi:class 3 adenylate cyclase
VAPDAGIPEAVDQLLQSLLAKSAGDRPADARTTRVALRELRKALPPESVVARPTADGVPFHERPTLLLEDGAPADRTTLPDIALYDAPTAVLAAPNVRMCTACGALNGLTSACTRCGAPLQATRGNAPSARAREILRATVGADPRFAGARASTLEASGDEAPIRRRLALVHAWLRPLTEDADAFRSELEPVIEAWREEVARLGGVVCHDSGSVVRALFGIEAAAAPGTPPPSRGAVAAAAVLRLAVRRARREDGIPFQLRVGIATAHVFLEPAAQVSPDWAIRGSSVDLASRLSRLASDGTVLLDAETATSVGSVARCRRVGHIGVRGQSVPNPVFALLTGAGAHDERKTGAGAGSKPAQRPSAVAATPG